MIKIITGLSIYPPKKKLKKNISLIFQELWRALCFLFCFCFPLVILKVVQKKKTNTEKLVQGLKCIFSLNEYAYKRKKKVKKKQSEKVIHLLCSIIHEISDS